MFCQIWIKTFCNQWIGMTFIMKSSYPVNFLKAPNPPFHKLHLTSYCSKNGGRQNVNIGCHFPLTTSYRISRLIYEIVYSPTNSIQRTAFIEPITSTILNFSFLPDYELYEHIKNSIKPSCENQEFSPVQKFEVRVYLTNDVCKTNVFLISMIGISWWSIQNFSYLFFFRKRSFL